MTASVMELLEILPIFLHHTSVWIYVLKLSERLDDYPSIDYYDVSAGLMLLIRYGIIYSRQPSANNC